MLTLAPIALVVHHNPVTDSAGSVLAAGPASGQTQPVIVIVVIVAVLLLGAALRQLRQAFAPIGELVRLMLSAVGVAVLLVGAIAVLIGGLALSAAGH